jgi:hypothetical protein
MKKLVTTTITLLMMVCFAQAERIYFGEFSIAFPKTYRSTFNGANLNIPEDYLAYETRGTLCATQIHVLNIPTEQSGQISFEQYSSYTEADFPVIAQMNRTTGYTLPIVKKINVQGIPILLFKQKNGDGVYELDLLLFVNEKRFIVRFYYTKDVYRTVNNIIDSIRRESSLPAPAGIAGEAVESI